MTLTPQQAIQFALLFPFVQFAFAYVRSHTLTVFIDDHVIVAVCVIGTWRHIARSNFFRLRYASVNWFFTRIFAIVAVVQQIVVRLYEYIDIVVLDQFPFGDYWCPFECQAGRCFRYSLDTWSGRSVSHCGEIANLTDTLRHIQRVVLCVLVNHLRCHIIRILRVLSEFSDFEFMCDIRTTS